MNAPTITMPREEAQQKLDAYRESVRRRHDEEHESLVKAYESLAEGTPLISLQEAIQSAGFDERMRPKLAIARADRTQVKFTWSSMSTFGVFDTRRNTMWSDTLIVMANLGRMHGQRTPTGYRIEIQAYALVPMIPAEVRNRMKGKVSEYLILWEVEEWSDDPLRAEPDRDPLLLKHIAGDLYAVLDSWDLTDIERLVMRGRRS